MTAADGGPSQSAPAEGNAAATHPAPIAQASLAVNALSPLTAAPVERDPFPQQRGNGSGPIYGALDLGTNNCRLLVARPSRR